MHINPLTAIDFYKADHRRQYPEGTTEIYSNLTARAAHKVRKANGWHDNKVVFFGLQYFIKDFLIDAWNEQFFKQDKHKVVSTYKRRMDNALGKDSISTAHIEALHDLGYLPLKIKAMPEGTRVPVGVPLLTIRNTHPDFFWLTNYIESVMSSYLWKIITSATTACEYRQMITAYALKTGSNLDFVPFQAHDFSLRGMCSLQDAAQNGAAHLTSFFGTDSVPGVDLLENYYNANSDIEMVGVSVPATEHSVMCMGTQAGELATFKRLINELYPTGIVSIVSDTWDFWKVVTEYMQELKEEILKRDGKVVIRPDSGDPVKIICGDIHAAKNSPEYKGAIEILWDIFGGVTTSTGHKMLDSHIGLIYGDSITLERAEEILKTLEQKGFASGNVVFGIGSYTYQYVTRDNFGFATKATSGVINGKRISIFKDPKTDSGTKKSASGLLRVEMENSKIALYDNQTEEQEQQGLLECVFLDGKIMRETSLKEVRTRILG